MKSKMPWRYSLLHSHSIGYFDAPSSLLPEVARTVKALAQTRAGLQQMASPQLKMARMAEELAQAATAGQPSVASHQAMSYFIAIDGRDRGVFYSRG